MSFGGISLLIKLAVRVTVLRRFCLGLGVLLLTSCSTMTFTDLFVTYSDQMAPARNQWQRGDALAAVQTIDAGGKNDTGYYLKQLEIGRLAFLGGQWEQSLETFGRVDAYLEDLDKKAQYRVSSGLSKVGTALTNDSAIRYEIPTYERVMLHHYQALNYLKIKGLESALVEVRRANQLQEKALREHEDEIVEVSDSYQSQYESVQRRYPSLDALIGETKNAFQNAYTFALSAVLYEADGSLNDAYIDYRKALEIAPANPYLARQVARLGKRLGITDAAALTQGADASAFESNQGQLVVLYEQGLVPHRQEIGIAMGIGGRGQGMLATVSFPVLDTRPTPSQPLLISVAGRAMTTSPITAVQSLAARHLKDQLPGMMLRQVIRLVSKSALSQQFRGDGAAVLSLFSNLYSLVSEHADTRSWETLPAITQFSAAGVPAGEHLLQLGRYPHKELPVTITPGRITLVMMSDIGHNYSSYVYQL
jgi:hypothetical protein